MRRTYTLPTGSLYAPYLLDLIEGNHTLIAGTVGAGKSVLENSIIHAILSARFPAQTADGRGAQLVLIDPKKVELDMYKNLPHTLLYADNISDIVSALQFVRAEIDRRLDYMKRHRQKKSTECPIYVFIDELVDLMASAAEKEISRLLSDSASISRATNIFFVALTQSPSRKIIPAKFKLLFNCRVALRCNNSIESRQIIDDDSATTLPLHGLGIVQQNLDRYQIKIYYHSDEELQKLVDHWTRQNGLLGRLSMMLA